jgi:integrase
MVTEVKQKDARGIQQLVGWQVRLLGYPLLNEKGERDPNGIPSAVLLPIKKNFSIAKGYKEKDANKFNREEETKRDKIEEERRFGVPERMLVPDRTIEELAAHYFEDESYTSLEPSSQLSYRGIIEEFLEWNKAYGRPTVSLWSKTVAKARIKALREGYRRPDGRWMPPREGQGLDKNMIMNRKLFLLELTRKPSALQEDPWPTVKLRRSIESQLDPRPYSREEMAALFEHMEPYQKLVFTLRYNVGCRAEELLKLRREHVEREGGVPVRIVFSKTKTHRPRKVWLNGEAARATIELLAQADESGYVVQRSFVTTSPVAGRYTGGKRMRTPLLFHLEQIKKRAVETYPEFKHAFFGRVAEIEEGKRKPRRITNDHTFRATFVTELLEANVNVVVVAQIIGDDVATVVRSYAGILNRGHQDAVHKLPPAGGPAGGTKSGKRDRNHFRGPLKSAAYFGHPNGHSKAHGHPNGHPS